MHRLTAHAGIILLLLATWTFAQAPRSVEEFEKRSRDIEARELAVPFKGITANGQVEPGLFGLKSTGVSTEPVRKAAEAFRYCRRVFIAPPWREIFTKDAERRQDFAEAEQTYEALAETYTQLGYKLVTVPCLPVAERLKFVLDATLTADKR